MNLRRTKAVGHKEFLHILRDPRSLVMALALPGLMLVLFGYALTLDVDRIPLLVYDASKTPRSRDLLSRFEGSRFFQIQGFAEDYRIIEDAIDRSQILAGLVIPRDYSIHLGQGKTADIQLLLDGSDSNTAAIALGYAQAIVLAENAELQARFLERKLGQKWVPPLENRTRIWYNSELKSKNYIVPGLVAVILMIIAALLTSLTIAREWEMGTMEQLLSTPVRSTELVLGKMSAYFLLGAADTAFVIVLGVTVFDVPLRGDLLLLAFSCFVFLFGALCWGILLSAAARTQLLAYQLGMITSFLPAFLLSGFMFTIENMPIPVQAFTYLVPARYFVTVLRGISLKQVGLEILGWDILFLIAFAVIVFLLASRKLKGEIV